ncbi:hypothetical protein [Lysobacter capsici]|uniref:hypothetical protein n=1 Tax=Lysobacter capsici TaxID=435897 RepID=UPI00398C8FA6
MSRFEALQRRVNKREKLLEGRYQQAVERKNELKASWREAWTPGRIVIAGLVSGFVMGRAEPVKIAVKSGNLMQIVTLLSGLFAGTSAQEAAQSADKAPARPATRRAKPATPPTARRRRCKRGERDAA